MTHDPAHDSAPESSADPTATPGPAQPLTPTPVVPLQSSAGRAEVAFAERMAGPDRRRVSLGAGAALALAVGAAATAFAAGPSPALTGSDEAGTTPAPVAASWAAPAAVGAIVDDGSAGFDHGRFGGPGGLRDITVTAIDGSALSLETIDGWTRTVTVTAGTELTKGGQPIELSDIAVGDEIRLRQEIAEDDTVTVTAIEVVVPSVAGEVSERTDSGFTVTTRDGSAWTITVTGDTVYRYGAADGTAADIEDGGMVHVQGTSTGDDALSATSVTVEGDHAIGTVTASTADTITIEDRDGDSVVVHVDEATVYRIDGTDDGALADIAVGDVIAVSGRERDDGSIDAAAVLEGGRGFGPGLGGPGRHGGHGGPGLGPDVAPDDGAEGSSTDAG
jgi:hypothetical protein